MTGLDPSLGWLAAAIAAVVGLGAVAGALTAIAVGVRHAWRFFRRFIATVDIIASLPDELKAINDRHASHLEEVAAERKAIHDELKQIRAVSEAVAHEVTNNGGSSMKDSVHRLERAAGLPEPTSYPPTSETPIVKPAPKRRPRKPSPAGENA